MKTSRVVAVLTFAVIAGCTVRLGGPEPEEYRTLAWDAGGATTPDQVAEGIARVDADVVLLAARRDSTWFREVAELAGRTLSGPGSDGELGMAFLAGEPVGDTTIVLSTDTLEAGAGDDGVLVHDALYEVDDDRYLDLMLMRVEDHVDARAAVTALLNYMATDVMPQSAVVLGVRTDRAASADTIARLLRPTMASARTCMSDDDIASDDGSGAAVEQAAVQLFLGPELRIFCEDARFADGVNGPIFARLVVRR